jgi:hypothetical protein
VKVRKETREKGEWRWGKRPERQEIGGGKETREKGKWRWGRRPERQESGGG